MATAFVTIKIMPETADIDMKDLEKRARELVTSNGGEVGKVEIEPIAFGLSSINLIIVVDDKNGTGDFEEKLATLEGVQTAQIIDFRRAIG